MELLSSGDWIEAEGPRSTLRRRKRKLILVHLNSVYFLFEYHADFIVDDYLAKVIFEKVGASPENYLAIILDGSTVLFFGVDCDAVRYVWVKIRRVTRIVAHALDVKVIENILLIGVILPEHLDLLLKGDERHKATLDFRVYDLLKCQDCLGLVDVELFVARVWAILKVES